ncbi:hypothetical protein scyTo_0025126, partial [Scyliorhinus torazame]|nr:hypothetical protein [Scyliorhinus torazame]
MLLCSSRVPAIPEDLPINAASLHVRNLQHAGRRTDEYLYHHRARTHAERRHT